MVRHPEVGVLNAVSLENGHSLSATKPNLLVQILPSCVSCWLDGHIVESSFQCSAVPFHETSFTNSTFFLPSKFTRSLKGKGVKSKGDNGLKP
jgi:hypothetical protein